MKPVRKTTGGKKASVSRELRGLLWRLRHTERTNPFPPTSLWEAANLGDFEAAKLFLQRGDDINAGSEPPLERAVRSGVLALVEYLLANGADPQPPSMLHSPLATAVELGHVQIARCLLKVCDPAIEEWAIPGAARCGQIECLKLLWAAGVARVNAGYALVYAVERGFYDCASFLVDSGVDPHSHPNYVEETRRGTKRRTALQIAKLKGRRHILDRLQGKIVDEKGALAAQKKTLQSRSAARESMMSQHEKWRPCSSRPFDVSQRPSALARASEILAKFGSRITLASPAKDEGTLLDLAVETGEKPLVEAVLSLGARATKSALFLAVEHGFVDISRLLMVRGAKVDGQAILIPAARRDDPELVRLLLEAGADPRAKDVFGRTPLWFAKGPKGRIVKEMLERGTKQVTRSQVRKALEIAQVKGGVISDSRSGVHCFRVNSPNREWSVMAIHAPLEKVSKAVGSLRRAVRWEQDCGERAIRPGKRGLFLGQLQGSGWTLLFDSYDWACDFEEQTKVIAKLSRKLSTTALGYYAEDTSGVEGYELFEKGKRVENGCLDESEGVEDNESRSTTVKNASAAVLFERLQIIIAPFWIIDDGTSISLRLGNVSRRMVKRLDYVSFQEN